MGGPPRGRLIQRFLCELFRLDTVATSTVVGGGYDPVFGEPIPVSNGTQTGAPSRREHTAVLVPCQVDRRDWEDDKLLAGGHDPLTTILLTLHFQDLEELGLVHTDASILGRPKIGPGDRIGSIQTTAGVTVIKFPVPPGLYVEGAEEAGWGLDIGGTSFRNLLILTCRPRRQGEL